MNNLLRSLEISRPFRESSLSFLASHARAKNNIPMYKVRLREVLLDSKLLMMDIMIIGIVTWKPLREGKEHWVRI